MTAPPSPQLPLLPEPHPAGEHPTRACPVCGENWKPMAFSRLPCHARCLFTPEGQAKLLRLGARHSTVELVAMVGTTEKILRANMNAALRRQAMVTRRSGGVL